MSKLIEEIAEESGMTQYVASNNKYLERFAQAILKACIDSIETYQIPCGERFYLKKIKLPVDLFQDLARMN